MVEGDIEDLAETRVPIELVEGIIDYRRDLLDEAREEMADDPMDPDALHEYRKCSRRLEAAVFMARGGLKPTDWNRALRAVADLTRGTGDYRDGDVQTKRLEEWRDEAPKTAEAGLDRLVDHLEELRTEGREDAVETALERSSPDQLGAALDRRIGRSRPDAYVEPLARQAVDVLLRWHGFRTEPDRGPALHAFRLSVKYFRYGLGHLAWATQGETSQIHDRREDQSEDVTDLLGLATDAMATLEVVGEAQDGADAAAEPGLAWVGARARETVEEVTRTFLAGFGEGEWPVVEAGLRDHAAAVPPLDAVE